jgi:hypothetical protein
MQEIGFEQILILLLFLLFPLLQLLLGPLRRRSAPPAAVAESEIRNTPEPEERPWFDAPPYETLITNERPPARVAHQRVSSAPRRDAAKGRRLGGRSDLRRAIALSVILGPCRANEPPP